MLLTHNALAPQHLTIDERLSELAAILALGVVRLKAAKSSELSAGQAHSALHFGGTESVCRTHRNGGTE